MLPQEVFAAVGFLIVVVGIFICCTRVLFLLQYKYWFVALFFFIACCTKVIFCCTMNGSLLRLASILLLRLFRVCLFTWWNFVACSLFQCCTLWIFCCATHETDRMAEDDPVKWYLKIDRVSNSLLLQQGLIFVAIGFLFCICCPDNSILMHNFFFLLILYFVESRSRFIANLETNCYYFSFFCCVEWNDWDRYVKWDLTSKRVKECTMEKFLSYVGC